MKEANKMKKDLTIIGYKTEDGFEFYFNERGELTDGDLVWSAAEFLLSTVEAKPIHGSDHTGEQLAGEE